MNSELYFARKILKWTTSSPIGQVIPQRSDDEEDKLEDTSFHTLLMNDFF